ncbi:hypothetical protein [Candidatus Hodgkinia cicadicola]|uniref:hypothetical protein n=1 Tax=Candidatus Hodgkinia cicadicola TaxID=573658 RepID=UPI0011BA492B
MVWFLYPTSIDPVGIDFYRKPIHIDDKLRSVNSHNVDVGFIITMVFVYNIRTKSWYNLLLPTSMLTMLVS